MSAGRFRIIVESAAYANVAMARHVVSAASEVTYAAGISSVIAAADAAITRLRADRTGHPRAISALEHPPPAKFPRSAARNGTQKASRLSSRLKPRDTR